MASNNLKRWLVLVAISCTVRQSLQLGLPVEKDDSAARMRQPTRGVGGYPEMDEDHQNLAELFAESYPDALGGSVHAGLAADEYDTPRGYDYDDEVFSGRLEVVDHWPVRELEGVGEISGLGTDPEGYLYVFHRASRHWTEQSFDDKNIFAEQSAGPIKEPTIFKINSSNGVILDKTGENTFYLPHGLTIDSKGNKWVTDVALHQVLKFEPGKTEPSLILGKKFEAAQNSTDTERFCKPTDVAVASSGEFFVSDGYCSSRIIKFNKDGKFLVQFGVDDFDVAHSLALAEDLDLICGADREGMRVLCYNAGLKDSARTGEPEREYTDEGLGRVYVINYSQRDGVLYGVTGLTGILIPQGFTIDLRDDEHYRTDFIAAWSPDDQGFDSPHALAVSPDGESVFVGELKEKSPLWKFRKEPLNE